MIQRPHRSPALAGLLVVQMALPGSVQSAPAASPIPNDDATIVHVLSRLTFGADPSTIASVKRVGLSAWIDAQLRPGTGNDPALSARLSALPTLSMSTVELREKYEVPVRLRQQVQKARAEYEARTPMEGGTEGDGPGARRAERQAMVKQFPELASMQGGPPQVIAELQAAKVLRASLSERQLEEVMVDFWFNHFNVFARKGPVEFMVADYEKAIRAHALGRFEDLLVATAKSPAMLFYLDNWQSTDPNFSPRRRANGLDRRRPGNTRGVGSNPGFRPDGRMGQPNRNLPGEAPAQPRRTFGINENYVRELMELHTLGVDGGYTQADVVEVAKAFTGWTIVGEGPGGPRQNKDSRFGFEEARHVKGDKHVLGATIRNGGEKEGLEILHRLATSPATANFISTKLVRRFVADEPPKALVGRVAATFTRTDGDIREVLRTLFSSEEFLGPAFRSAKIKTPLEFVVSSVRASGAEVRDARDLARRISAMGMPLYLQQPPTGYKDTAEEWISSAALLERMNFALDLSSGRVRGVSLDASSLADPGATLDTIAARILPSGLSERSLETLEAEARKEGGSPAHLVGLVLGSPEFQKR